MFKKAVEEVEISLLSEEEEEEELPKQPSLTKVQT